MDPRKVKRRDSNNNQSIKLYTVTTYGRGIYTTKIRYVIDSYTSWEKIPVDLMTLTELKNYPVLYIFYKKR